MLFLKYLATSAVALAVALLSGCSTVAPVYNFDPDFSMNVAKSSFNAKNFVTLSPAEKEIHSRYGPPDFIRFFWNPQGDLAGRMQRLSAVGKKPKDLERTWVYLQRGVEVCFKGRTEYDIKPLSDSIRLLCEQGDPEEVVEHRENKSHPYSDFIYYKKGIRYKMDENGQMLQKMSFTRMGQ